MTEVSIKYFLSVSKCINGENKLWEKSHPKNEKNGEDTEQVLKYGVTICLNSPHAVNLPKIYNQQENQPAGNVEPWSFIERNIVHVPEFYIKNW